MRSRQMRSTTNNMGYKKYLRSARHRAAKAGSPWLSYKLPHPRERTPVSGRKTKRRNLDGHYLKGVHGWVGKHKTTAERANRQERHRTKVEIRP